MPLARCPICDVDRAALTPIESFVLGIGVRASLDDSKSIAENMCAAHRMPTFLAIVALAQKVAALP